LFFCQSQFTARLLFGFLAIEAGCSVQILEPAKKEDESDNIILLLLLPAAISGHPIHPVPSPCLFHEQIEEEGKSKQHQNN
jgi:hypothetical protein